MIAHPWCSNKASLASHVTNEHVQTQYHYPESQSYLGLDGSLITVLIPEHGLLKACCHAQSLSGVPSRPGSGSGYLLCIVRGVCIPEASLYQYLRSGAPTVLRAPHVPHKYITYI